MEMVAFPSKLDSYMKCQLGLDGAGHYMDDYYLLVPPGLDPKSVFQKFREKAAETHLLLNDTKTRIVPFGEPFRFCKAKYAMTETGRIVIHAGRDAAKRGRRKMRAFCEKVQNGEMSYVDLWSSVQSVLNYYAKMDDHGRVLSLRRFFYALYGFSAEKFRNFKSKDITKEALRQCSISRTRGSTVRT